MARRRRTKQGADWRAHGIRTAIWGTILIALLWGVGLFATSPMPSNIAHYVRSSFDGIVKNQGFVVKQVTVKGRTYTNVLELKKTLNVEIGDLMTQIDIEKMQDRISKLPWVESSQIQKRWPSTLYIVLIEKTPVARWQKNAHTKTFVIDSGGDVIVPQSSKFKGLPLVEGVGANKNAADLFALLNAQPEIGKRFVKARRISDRRWNVVLQNNIVVQLPADDAGLALERAAKEQQRSGILDKENGGYIDARTKDRLILGK